MKNRRCCIDYVPKTKSRGVAPTRKLWEPGQVLSVRFLAGNKEMHDFVERVAKQWSEHANIHFEFNNASDADIRISFNQGDGAWSTVGIDARLVPPFEATMNLGWLDEQVVLHEFGHAIGLGHEHQNPIGGIQWNKEVVYRELAGPPNFWSKEIVDSNLFDKYNEDQVIATEVDPLSIMMYPIQEECTLNDFSVDFNPSLSEMDKAFVATLYPFSGDSDPIVPPLTSNELAVSFFNQYKSAITTPGEVNEFSFKVPHEGMYLIETVGNTDMYLSLFGPDNTTQLIAEDDDSGTSRNSKIGATLTPGTYYLKVRHYDQTSGVGAYEISIVSNVVKDVTPPAPLS